jgi:hypothetical protein
VTTRPLNSAGTMFSNGNSDSASVPRGGGGVHVKGLQQDEVVQKLHELAAAIRALPDQRPATRVREEFLSVTAALQQYEVIPTCVWHVHRLPPE